MDKKSKNIKTPIKATEQTISLNTEPKKRGRKPKSTIIENTNATINNSINLKTNKETEKSVKNKKIKEVKPPKTVKSIGKKNINTNIYEDSDSEQEYTYEYKSPQTKEEMADEMKMLKEKLEKDRQEFLKYAKQNNPNYNPYSAYRKYCQDSDDSDDSDDSENNYNPYVRNSNFFKNRPNIFNAKFFEDITPRPTKLYGEGGEEGANRDPEEFNKIIKDKVAQRNKELEEYNKKMHLLETTRANDSKFLKEVCTEATTLVDNCLDTMFFIIRYLVASKRYSKDFDIYALLMHMKRDFGMEEDEEFDPTNPFKYNIFTRFAENHPNGSNPNYNYFQPYFFSRAENTPRDENFFKAFYRPTENFGFYKGRKFDEDNSYSQYKQTNQEDKTNYNNNYTYKYDINSDSESSESEIKPEPKTVKRGRPPTKTATKTAQNTQNKTNQVTTEFSEYKPYATQYAQYMGNNNESNKK